MIAVEEGAEERPFVALDDLERLAMNDATELPEVFGQLRTVFDSWQPRTGGVYVRRSDD
jgi:hypothetical protein